MGDIGGARVFASCSAVWCMSSSLGTGVRIVVEDIFKVC